jgi:hypothetical protein
LTSRQWALSRLSLTHEKNSLQNNAAASGSYFAPIFRGNKLRHVDSPHVSRQWDHPIEVNSPIKRQHLNRLSHAERDELNWQLKDAMDDGSSRPSHNESSSSILFVRRPLVAQWRRPRRGCTCMPASTHPHLLMVGTGSPIAVPCVVWYGARRGKPTTAIRGRINSCLESRVRRAS